MNDVLALCHAYPELRVAKGESVIEESVRTDRLYVLKEGAFTARSKGISNANAPPLNHNSPAT